MRPDALGHHFGGAVRLWCGRHQPKQQDSDQINAWSIALRNQDATCPRLWKDSSLQAERHIQDAVP